jgi:tRNA nucleotidyltransferase (CCA-adding enzyme)
LPARRRPGIGTSSVAGAYPAPDARGSRADATRGTLHAMGGGGRRSDARASSLALPDGAAVPEAVHDVLARLRADGHEAVLVGGCVRDLLRGVAVSDFDAATSAPVERVLALFPRAVPTGLRHGTVMIPTRAGPLDVTTFRAGPRLADDLAHRDFTVDAIAWEPASGRWLDPAGGRADLAAGRLRAVGSARERFAEDPLRALRAARLVATLGLAPDPEIEPAMREVRAALQTVARERVRHEIVGLLLAPNAEAGLRLLRASGIEEDLAPGVRDDAGAVVSALPRVLSWRLAGWLRGTRAEAILAALRVGHRLAREVTALLARHPLDAVPLRGDADARRLLRRLGDEGVAALLALRGAELAAAEARGADVAPARRRLEAVVSRLERVRAGGSLALRTADLALDGEDVMQLLDVGPGPGVGEALRHLVECVVEDPTCNTREALATRLRAWHAAHARR